MAMTSAVWTARVWAAQTDALMAEYLAARWDNLMVESMDGTTVVTMDACWAGRKAALKEALSAASRDVLWVA